MIVRMRGHKMCQAGWHRKRLFTLVPAYARTGVFYFITKEKNAACLTKQNDGDDKALI